MSEQVEVGTEQSEQPAVEERQPMPTGSLAEHEAQYTGEKPPPVVPELEAPAAETESAPEAPQQKRDKETGQFVEGKTRRRAKSQQAGADDVPRIKELTRQLREREEELARLRQPVSNGNGTGTHVPQPPSPAQTAASPKAGERYVLPAPPYDPEPQPNDPRFGGDVNRYTIEAAKWSARQETRQLEFDRYVESQQEAQKASEAKENEDFATRVNAAKAKYEDFDEIALEAPTPIKKDSIPDIFIRRDDNGAEVLYYLQHPTHRQELDELLKMPELAQVKFLSLLSQRLSSNGTGSIGAPTTSIPGSRTIVLPPKPPNVVRTEAQQASSGIPQGRELSLSEHEHYFRPKPRR